MTPPETPATTQTIGDIAQLVRAKNAGPFWLTLDVFCDTDDSYRLLAAEDVITPELIATLYDSEPSAVMIFRLPELRVLKISLPRPTTQGSTFDRDMHSGQQHVPLAQHTIGSDVRRLG